mmetsp:Transcript_31836/g.95807  ORF Transcript_31836/g.95807 Transcript_31836/m.95807 type:complete len:217 (+) Transcript_31836:90-740(+)
MWISLESRQLEHRCHHRHRRPDQLGCCVSLEEDSRPNCVDLVGVSPTTALLQEPLVLRRERCNPLLDDPCSGRNLPPLGLDRLEVVLFGGLLSLLLKEGFLPKLPQNLDESRRHRGVPADCFLHDSVIQDFGLCFRLDFVKGRRLLSKGRLQDVRSHPIRRCHSLQGCDGLLDCCRAVGRLVHVFVVVVVVDLQDLSDCVEESSHLCPMLALSQPH